MIYDDYDGQWYPGMDGGLRFPDICLTVEEKPQPGKLTRPGIEPGPGGWEAMMLPLEYSGGPIVKGGVVAQAVRRTPPIVGISSSRLDHSMWVSWWTKCSLGRFFLGFLQFSPIKHFIPPFLHFHVIHLVSYNLISPSDGATGVVSRHPWYSWTYNIGASSHHP